MPSDVIDYRLIGDDMQAVIVTLDPREAVIAEAGAMMYMEDGISTKTTELRFQSEATVIVGNNGDGALLVQGTAAAPVRFTANAASPNPGHWDDITF